MEYTNYGFEDGLRTLFRRCVACPDTTPSCPACADNEYCSQVSPTCSTCASRTCVSIQDSGSVDTGSNAAPSSGPNIGAIAGGTIAGLAVIALVTYLIWRFCIKNKRRASREDEAIEEKANASYARSQARASTHTVASMASTVMTRASNVIQIAFIPGITDRTNDQDEQNGTVPPVPAIPLQHQAGQPMSPYVDSPHDSPRAHYFMPRDSTYTGFSDNDSIRSSIRQSVAPTIRHSVAPSVAPSLARQSYASTIFHQDAAVTISPAQTAYRGKANVVSVKPGSGTSPNSSVPEMPQVDYFKYGNQLKDDRDRHQGQLKRQPSTAPSIAPSLAPSMAPSFAASDTASVRNMIMSSATAAAAGYPPNPPLSVDEKRKTTESTRIAAAISAAQRTSMQPPTPRMPPHAHSPRDPSRSPAQPQGSPRPDGSHKDPSPFSDDNATSPP